MSSTPSLLPPQTSLKQWSNHLILLRKRQDRLKKFREDHKRRMEKVQEISEKISENNSTFKF